MNDVYVTFRKPPV